eukprot:14446639-Alexandrium_andersonii.AAC.1
MAVEALSLRTRLGRGAGDCDVAAGLGPEAHAKRSRAGPPGRLRRSCIPAHPQSGVAHACHSSAKSAFATC